MEKRLVIALVISIPVALVVSAIVVPIINRTFGLSGSFNPVETALCAIGGGLLVYYTSPWRTK